MSEYEEVFLLGGGSNMLLLHDITIPVLHINTKGKEIIKENEKYVWVKVAAGENWHEFVLWCLDNNYGGVENLAKIPGNVGTAPIQNIGAYGVEAKDVIDEVITIEIASKEFKNFTNKQCKFSYRESVFKTEEKGKHIITDVIFKLTKKEHTLHYEYGAIKETLGEISILEPAIQDIAAAIIKIRMAKLPNPEEIGNSGSFFKNPIIALEKFKTIQEQYPDIPNYPVPNNNMAVKIAAGWLIDQCGYKGKRIGDAGVHKHQALVLVNYGNATGIELLSLAKDIQKSVKEKFDVLLEMEVNIIS